jgi:hypothetical protein
MYNCQQLATASGAVLQAVNGCATLNWGQMLTFQGKIGPDSKAFTNSGSMNLFNAPFSKRR